MAHPPFFSIIVVCLNPGGKLRLTLDSVLMQSFSDYEIIIKDGGSDDGIVEEIKAANMDARLRFFSEADEGIYDAMNQAVAKARGQFVYFLNCGDLLHDPAVLSNVKTAIDENNGGGIYYGNVYEATTSQVVFANPRLTRFACYRHPPCHQACFYRRELVAERPFMTKYRVKADYEHLLTCLLELKTVAFYLPYTIASYEGGGFSESKENRRLLALEHREIVGYYMSKSELFKYRAIMFLTFSRLRTALAKNKHTAATYNRLRNTTYKRHITAPRNDGP
jgi:glycosyltransferase involved in cell wall biosynthesis